MCSVCVCVEGRGGYHINSFTCVNSPEFNHQQATKVFQAGLQDWRHTSLTFQVGGVGHDCNLDGLPCHMVVPHSGHAQMVLDITRSLGRGEEVEGGRRGEGGRGHK